MWQSHFFCTLIFESHIIFNSTIHCSFCQKLKEGTRSPLSPRMQQTHFQSSNNIATTFLRCQCKRKWNFIFHNPFNYVIEEFPPNLHLEVIDLQCNDMLKDTYQEKNLIYFYKCLPNDKYAQLKPYAHRLIIRIWQYLSMRKDIFKDNICKIWLQICINRWGFAINFNNGNTNFEFQLRKISPLNNFILLVSRHVLRKAYAVLICVWNFT